MIHRQTMKLAIWKADLQSRGLYQSFDNSLILHINATTAIFNAEFDVLLTFNIWATLETVQYFLSSISPSLNCEGERLDDTLNSIQPFWKYTNSGTFLYDRWPYTSQVLSQSCLIKQITAYEGDLLCKEILLNEGRLYALLSQAMLTEWSTRSQGFYLRRIPIGLCHYWKWHQSVDTTNSTVCWQIISCTSCCLWLSFIMQMGNWVYLYDLEELNEVSDPFLSIRSWPSRFLRQSEYDSIDFELIWISKLHFGLGVNEIWGYLRH